jgi:hypothetical protein
MLNPIRPVIKVAANFMAANEHYLQTKRGFTDSDSHAGQKSPC